MLLMTPVLIMVAMLAVAFSNGANDVEVDRHLEVRRARHIMADCAGNAAGVDRDAPHRRPAGRSGILIFQFIA
jgi:hypothetical protein